ncbi:MAG: response regulator [Thermodesulfobacteriota bacterium]
MKALVVEDNESLRETLMEILETNFPDMQVSGACNSQEAMAEVDNNLPELIFMDIQIPGENGLKLTRKIKARYPDTVVVIHTNYDLPEYREAAVDYGADHFLSKEKSNPDEIVALVGSLFSNT